MFSVQDEGLIKGPFMKRRRLPAVEKVEKVAGHRAVVCLDIDPTTVLTVMPPVEKYGAE
jgi:hypothetical protein